MDVVPGSAAGLPAVLPANVNRTGRPLDTVVSPASVVPTPAGARGSGRTGTIDLELPRRAGDRQLVPVLVRTSAAERSAHPGLAVEIRCAAGLFTVLDQTLAVLPEASPGVVRVDLRASVSRFGRGDVLLQLEARTLPASPLVGRSASVTPDFVFVDGNGVEVFRQSGISGAGGATGPVAAPLRLVGDDGIPERVYLAEVDGNGPSVTEVTAAVAAAGVPLTLVPRSVNNGDAWLQDQFQVARLGDGPDALPALLHLPRAAHSSVVVPGAPNLRSLVDGYFPSDRLGVVKDLWNVPIRLPHAGGVEELGVAETYQVFRRLLAVGGLVDLLTEKVNQARERAGVSARRPPVPRGDPWGQRAAIPGLLGELQASTNQTPQVQELLRGMPERISQVDRTLALAPGPATTVTLTVERPASDFRATYGDADRHVLAQLLADLYAVHSSRSYGGNLEVTPPVGSAARGLTVTGTLHSQALRDLLTERGQNPDTAEVFTDWLEVGHLDEVAAFVSSRDDFSVLRASPATALAILRAARARQQAGTLVTRLFRGRLWDHTVTRELGATPLVPPGLHVRLSGPQSPHDLTELGVRVPRDQPRPRGGGAFHDDRAFLVLSNRVGIEARYAAMVTVESLLAVCAGTNEDIEHLFLGTDRIATGDAAAVRHWSDPPPAEALDQRLDAVLAARLPHQRVLPVPVVFDVVDTFRTRRTLAVSPDLVNLLNLGQHLVVPRPHGPRMRPADALALLVPLLRERTGIDCRWTVADLTARGLDRTWHWTRPGRRVYRASVGWRPTTFDPGYRDMMDAVALAAALEPAWASLQSGYRPPPTVWDIEHQRDPWSLHPEEVVEDLELVATWFRDGFDAFRNHPVDYARGDGETAHPGADAFARDIVAVMDAIRAANPGVFDAAGAITATDWVRIAVPEGTVDLFELWTQVVLEELGHTVHWADSWYYHTHSGGLHCGTNVLRRARF